MMNYSNTQTRAHYKNLKLEKLVEKLHTDNTIYTIIQATLANIKKALETQFGEMPAKTIETVLKAVQAWHVDVLNKAELNAWAIEEYAKYFTDDEITALIKFYQSQAGEKLLSLTPTIAQAISQKVESKLSAHASSLEATIQKVIA